MCCCTIQGPQSSQCSVQHPARPGERELPCLPTSIVGSTGCPVAPELQLSVLSKLAPEIPQPFAQRTVGYVFRYYMGPLLHQIKGELKKEFIRNYNFSLSFANYILASQLGQQIKQKLSKYASFIYITRVIFSLKM